MQKCYHSVSAMEQKNKCPFVQSGHMPLSLAVTGSAGDKSLYVTTESSQE